WKVTQAGQSLSSATAARRVTRATAQKALQQFLGRVERVNNDPYFLGNVTRVVLFGSMLKPEVERLSDVDMAVELASKEADFDRARAKNYERVEKLATQGYRFGNFLERECCWYWEVFRRADGSALRPLWRRRINFGNEETATTGPKQAPAGLPILTTCRSKSAAGQFSRIPLHDDHRRTGRRCRLDYR